MLERLEKWKLHRFYLKSPQIKKYLPQTSLLTPSSLGPFMAKYKTVYIKGNNMHTGRGIIKAWKTEKGYGFIRVREKAIFPSSINDLYNQVKRGNPKQTYIIQKAIDLAKINGRPFDIRVMMMRDAERKWQYAGMIAKVAGPGSIISNVRRGGGYATSIEHALAKSLGCGRARIESIKKELIALSFQIIHYSTANYPFYSFQSGIDLAVDKRGKVWIIEVNLHNPSHGLFRKLNDKTFFRRIKKLYFSYRSRNKRLI